MTCGKTQEFLAKRRIRAETVVDAKKKTLKFKDAVALLDGVDEIVSGKRGKVERVDLRSGNPDHATLARLLLGPTGNLRAPAFRTGRTLVVGFDEPAYKKLLG